MKLVTLTELGAKRLGTAEAVKMIARAGFDGYDATLCDMAPNRHGIESEILRGPDYMKWAKEIKSVADDNGICCTQSHSVYPTLTNLKDTKDMLYYNERCMEITSFLGGDVIVIHPGNNFGVKENYEYMYDKLLPLAEKYDLRIATENMWNRRTDVDYFESIPAACGTSADFIAHVDKANSPRMVACVDIGHAEMKNVEGAANLIRALGHDRVKALHVHDNDLLHDSHWFPFQGNIKWDGVIEALKDIDYDGNFTFEADTTLYGLPNELLQPAYDFLEKIGRYFVRRLNKN